MHFHYAPRAAAPGRRPLRFDLSGGEVDMCKDLVLSAMEVVDPSLSIVENPSIAMPSSCLSSIL